MPTKTEIEQLAKKIDRNSEQFTVVKAAVTRILGNLKDLSVWGEDAHVVSRMTPERLERANKMLDFQYDCLSSLCGAVTEISLCASTIRAMISEDEVDE